MIYLEQLETTKFYILSKCWIYLYTQIVVKELHAQMLWRTILFAPTIRRYYILIWMGLLWKTLNKYTACISKYFKCIQWTCSHVPLICIDPHSNNNLGAKRIMERIKLRNHEIVRLLSNEFKVSKNKIYTNLYMTNPWIRNIFHNTLICA